MTKLTVAFSHFAKAPNNAPLNVRPTANRYIVTSISILHDTARCQFLLTTFQLTPTSGKHCCIVTCTRCGR